MSSNVLQPNPPHQPASLSFSLIKPTTTCLPEMPFCNPPKNPIFFITVFQNKIIFFTELCGLFWVFSVVLVRASQRKQESKARNFSFIIFFLPSLSFLFLSALFLLFPLPSSLFHHPFLCAPPLSLSI